MSAELEVIYNRPILAEDKPLPEQIRNNLLSAFGNHEAKALVLIAMEPGELYSSDDLHKLFLSGQGSAVTEKTDRRLQYNYCKHSLEPIGMVARECEDATRDVKAYQITEFGFDIGRSFAGQMLDFSITQGISLHALGRTNTSGEKPNRPPVDSLKILGFIAANRNKPLTIADIKYELGDIQVRPRLIQLGRAGLIHFDSPGDDLDVIYEICEPELAPESENRHGRIGKLILAHIATLKQGDSISLNSIATLVEDSQLAVSMNRRRYRGLIANLLSELMKLSILSPSGEFDATHRTSIRMSDTQSYVVGQLMQASGGVLDLRQYMREGHNKADRILKSSWMFRRLAHQAMANSRSKNQTTSEDVDVVRNILTEGSAISTTAIGKEFQIRTGKSFSGATIKNMLRRLEGADEILSQKEGSYIIWSKVKSSPDE